MKTAAGNEVEVAASVVAGAASEEDVDEATTAAALTLETTPEEDPKLLAAFVDSPATTFTPLMVTTSPSVLVTLTSTVVVPKPLDFSKKLYSCLVVDFQVLPPSVLTSRVETSLLALTTCMLNQYAETPSLLWTARGEVIGQST